MKFVSYCSLILMVFCLPLVLMADEPAKPSEVQRGGYLVLLGGCNDCHTSKKMTPHGPVLDESLILAGYHAEGKLPEIPQQSLGFTPDKWMTIANQSLTAWAGPWGVSFTANLTPDMETGLGSWTADMFVKAIRTGKHMGEGRPILPPMPVEAMAQFKEEDLRAIFAYLKSIKPVHNAVPDPMPPPAPPK